MLLALAAASGACGGDGGGGDAPASDAATDVASDTGEDTAGETDTSEDSTDDAADAEPDTTADVDDPDVRPASCFDDLAPGEVEVFYDGFPGRAGGGTEGIAFGPDGRLYATGLDAVWAFDADGTRHLIATVDSALGLAPTATGMVVAVIGESNAPGVLDGAVAHVTTAGDVQLWATGIASPNFATLLPDGSALISDDFDTRVWRVTADGTVAEAIVDIGSPNGMAYTPDGDALIVASTFTADGEITRIPVDDDGLPLADGWQVLARLGGDATPDGIAIDTEGDIYVAANLRNELIRVPADGGEPEVVASDLGTPASLAFGNGEGFDPCSVYVTQLFGSQILRVAVGREGAPLVPDVDFVDVPTPDGPDDWTRSYPDAATHPAPEGMRWARSIVHLHSTHSHDACDGDPRPDGEYNLECLDSLRSALCDTNVDIAWLTDHPEHMVEVPFVDALLHLEDAGDTLELGDDDQPLANRIACENGREVVVRAGTESSLMPVGLGGHLADDEAERYRLHGGRNAESVEAFRASGALVWQAHAEERSREDMRAVELDGFEIYQLHANIDPSIREESLGLDPGAPFEDLAPFLFGTTDVHPDLAFLLFLDDNRPSLAHWADLLADGPIVGTAGTDAHENVFSVEASDGERLDSYRRMLSWFANYVLVDGELTAANTQAALAAGRVYLGFDVLGDPGGFGAWLEVDGERFEMGSNPNSGETATLHVTVPTPQIAGGPEGEVTGRVLRADGDAWQPVGTTFGPGTHEIELTEPGAYRVELRTSAAHLRPWLAEYALPLALADFPWVMSNAFRWRLDG